MLVTAACLGLVLGYVLGLCPRVLVVGRPMDMQHRPNLASTDSCIISHVTVHPFTQTVVVMN